ncbi:MAG TPA: EutN/CcmL family microcompartment protein [Thermogutta sp.]|nr:EutN/CcmL family microcompartment protein [Thermogutta sp.]
MLAGRVVGHATSTVKHPSMQGLRLLLVQPVAADGRSPDGDPILVVDHLGAGRGDLVIVTSDGKHTQTVLKDAHTPVRWSVIGIVD